MAMMAASVSPAQSRPVERLRASRATSRPWAAAISTQGSRRTGRCQRTPTTFGTAPAGS
jgi:hypothetical protein